MQGCIERDVCLIAAGMLTNSSNKGKINV